MTDVTPVEAARTVPLRAGWGAMTPWELLDAAADSGRWCRGEGEPDGRRDVIGMLWRVVPEDLGQQEARDLVVGAEELLRKALGLESITDLPSWNDAPVHTEEDVIRSLRRTARLAKAGDIE